MAKYLFTFYYFHHLTIKNLCKFPLTIYSEIKNRTELMKVKNDHESQSIF